MAKNLIKELAKDNIVITKETLEDIVRVYGELSKAVLIANTAYAWTSSPKHTENLYTKERHNNYWDRVNLIDDNRIDFEHMTRNRTLGLLDSVILTTSSDNKDNELKVCKDFQVWVVGYSYQIDMTLADISYTLHELRYPKQN